MRRPGCAVTKRTISGAVLGHPAKRVPRLSVGRGIPVCEALAPADGAFFSLSWVPQTLKAALKSAGHSTKCGRRGRLCAQSAIGGGGARPRHAGDRKRRQPGSSPGQGGVKAVLTVPLHFARMVTRRRLRSFLNALALYTVAA